MRPTFRLISHVLCPYVQRAAIVASEHGIAFERVTIDLAAKPDWFLAMSPTGKVPVLEVTEQDGAQHILFESAAIAEYLDEIADEPMLATDPIARAQERAWIEYASGTLAAIAALYGAADEAAFQAKRDILVGRFTQLEKQICRPWFSGARFGLVDAAFAPVFRYLATFENEAGLELVRGMVAIAAWRSKLALRQSVIGAVTVDYPARLRHFLVTQGTWLSKMIESGSDQAAKAQACPQ